MTKKIITLTLFTLLLTLTLTACGNKTAGESSGPSGSTVRPNNPGNSSDPVTSIIVKDFVAESHTLPDIPSIVTAVFDGKTVYFIGNETGVSTPNLFYFDIDTPTEITQRFLGLGTGVSARNLFLSKNGDLYLSVIENTDAFLDEGTRPDVSIRQIEKSGREISRVTFSGDTFDEEYIFPQNLIVDAAGRIYFDNNGTIYVGDKEGNLLNKISVQSPTLKLTTDYNEENVYVVWSSNSGKIEQLDLNSGFLGNSKDLPGISSVYGLSPVSSSEMLIASQKGLHTYDMENFSSEQILAWDDVYLFPGEYGTLIPLNDGRFGWLESKSGRSEFHIIRPPYAGEEILAKEILTIGVIGLDWFATPHALRTAVYEFNRNYPEYYLHIIDYNENGSVEGYLDGLRKLNLDIINRKGADIIVLPPNISLDLYARKGILADLYPFIDGDNTMERADFHENIVAAFETEGQLFGMPIFFELKSIAAAASELPGINGWNLDEMINYVNGLLPESKVFLNHSKTDVLELCLFANGDALVDWLSDDSGFNRDLFLKMLYFADQFTPPELISYDYDNYADAVLNGISDQQLQLLTVNISIYFHYFHDLSAFGEPVTYPGYPSENGNGTLIHSDAVLSINQTCHNKDAAWKFISSMLTHDFQTRPIVNRVAPFPILRSAHQTLANKAMHEDNYIFFWGGEFPRATASDIQFVNELISRAEKIRVFDDQIMKIVMEEAGAFFSGAKSAEEVADIAGNRIGIYVSEMK